MNIKEFDYHLPPELIAQEPLARRAESRLLVLDRQTGKIEHRYFKDIAAYLRKGDLLVSNNTRVIPARLFGTKEKTGAQIEVVLLKRLDQSRWEAMVRPGKRVKAGTNIIFGQGMLVANVQATTPTGEKILEFSHEGIFEEKLALLGQIPLPPYIHKKLQDPERYQTVYARHPGSAAAPTAGLHFTPELIGRLEKQGIEWVEIMLHIGIGTFRPVKTEDITLHSMHSEDYDISVEAALKINKALAEGRRIIAVGTTSARALESACEDSGVIPGSNTTQIFIYPGYKFKVIDGMITNFHLPKSTLLMLVSALAGKDSIMNAYAEAVLEKYRFFSFGDAMLII